MFVAGGAGGDFDDREWGAGLCPRAPELPVNRATRAVVIGTGIAGLVATIAAFALTADQGWGNPLIILALAIPVAIGWAYPLRILRNEEAETMHLDEAYFVIAVLLLPPMGALAIFLLGTAAGLLWSRTVLAKFVFNLGQVMLSVVVGTGIFVLFSSVPPGTIEPTAVIGAVVGAITMAVVGQFAVSLVISVSEDVSLAANLRDGLWPRLLQWVSAVSIGVLAGISAASYPWVLLIALVPLVMVRVVLGEHLRAQLDRERLDGLLRTAQEVHSSIDSDDVTHSLVDSAKELLRARDAWIGTAPPADEQRGVRIPISDDQQWLVVGGRKGMSGFNPEDVQLLEAIGAIGASALENAHLVSQIRHQATHDRLTGLPNQLLFEDRVNQAVQRARRLREKLAVLMLDLDAFQKVNASLGHAVGNELLKRVGGRLLGAIREGDTVARMSADDFTILLPGVGEGEALGTLAEQLLTAVSRPFVVDGHELFMTASAGIAVFPDDGAHAGQLLRNADTAMHRAKDAGGNCTRLYDAGTNELAQIHLARRSELHNALRRDELRVLYQPQIDLRTGHIVGVEALVRWEHPTLGLLTPADFVPLAEESDLVVEVDTWVLRHACAQAVTWDHEGLPALRMAANLSGRNFSDDRIIGRVATVLRDSGLAAQRLELEITESLALRESEGALDIIRRVRDLGVRFAIDDFGTGYSALAQMQRFPVDRLKIDRTFVNQITSAQGVAPLVSAFIGIARALRLEVVAEGVETLEQQTFLRTHGCKEAQGFLYSRPIPPEEVAVLVRKPSLGLHVAGQND